MSEERKYEVEHRGSIWSHPYMLYSLITLGLFGFLGFLAYVAVENGMIPDRGVSKEMRSGP